MNIIFHGYKSHFSTIFIIGRGEDISTENYT